MTDDASRPAIISETGSKPTFLMIEPTGYTVDGWPKYVINQDLSRAKDSKWQQQLSWHVLRAVIESVGGHVQALPATPRFDAHNQRIGYGTGGETFVRDPYCIIAEPGLKLAIRGRPHMIEKRDPYMEMDRLNGPLTDHGFTFIDVPDAIIEGGNLLYHSQTKTLFQGYHATNGLGNSEACQKLSNALGKVIPKGMVVRVPVYAAMDPFTKDFTPSQFHLDLCMAVLPGGEILLDSEKIPEPSIRNIQKRVGADKVICISSNGYTFNQIAVGDTLIAPLMSRGLQRVLEERGYRIVTPDSLAKDETLLATVYEKLCDYGVAKRPDDPPGGLRCTKEELVQLLENPHMSVDFTLSKRRGGPHCMTLPLEPGTPPVREERHSKDDALTQAVRSLRADPIEGAPFRN